MDQYIFHVRTHYYFGIQNWQYTVVYNLAAYQSSFADTSMMGPHWLYDTVNIVHMAKGHTGLSVLWLYLFLVELRIDARDYIFLYNYSL